MAYRKLTTRDVPRRSRLSTSRFENTHEWRMLRADIDAGLKADDVLEIRLTEADKKKYNLMHRRTVTRFIKKYLESKGFPYRVRSFHRDDEGDFFLVQYGVRGTNEKDTRTGKAAGGRPSDCSPTFDVLQKTDPAADLLKRSE